MAPHEPPDPPTSSHTTLSPSPSHRGTIQHQGISQLQALATAAPSGPVHPHIPKASRPVSLLREL